MENSKEFLQKAIDSIKKHGTMEEKDITQEDIALRLNLTKELLCSYLTGEENMPSCLVAKLLSCYGRKLKTIRFSKEYYIDLPPEDEQKGED